MSNYRVVSADVNANGHCPKSANGRHWWMIEGANGPVSQGRCRFCGIRKEFQNSWDTKRWKSSDAMLYPEKGEEPKDGAEQ